MVSASVIGTVIVLHINAVSSLKPVPSWLRWLLLDKLPRFVCLDIKMLHNNQDSKADKIDHGSDGTFQQQAGCNINEAFDPAVEGIPPDLHPTRPEKRGSGSHLNNHCNGSERTSELNNEHKIKSDWQLMALVIDRCLLVVFATFVFVVTITIFTIIIIGSKQEYDQEIEYLYNEWANETLIIK